MRGTSATSVHPVNLKRLASLTALGAGALGLAAPDAQASIVVIPSGVTVGFGASSSASFALPGAVSFKLSTFAASTDINLRSTHGYFRVQRSGGFLAAAPAGATIGSSRGGSALVVHHATNTPFTATNKYFLFYFLDTSHAGDPRYGWGELSLANPGGNAQATLVQYAYDDTGAMIAAGDTGAAVPEPNAFALTGLGALALGARGIRRWRAARQS
jgi:hypothetical protein